MTTPDNLEVQGGITEDQAASEMLKRWGASDDKEKSPHQNRKTNQLRSSLRVTRNQTTNLPRLRRKAMMSKST